MLQNRTVSFICGFVKARLSCTGKFWVIKFVVFVCFIVAHSHSWSIFDCAFLGSSWWQLNDVWMMFNWVLTDVQLMFAPFLEDLFLWVWCYFKLLCCFLLIARSLKDVCTMSPWFYSVVLLMLSSLLCCLNNVCMMFEWCLSDIWIIFGWCLNDVRTMSGWCQKDVCALSPWFFFHFEFVVIFVLSTLIYIYRRCFVFALGCCSP